MSSLLDKKVALRPNQLFLVVCNVHSVLWTTFQVQSAPSYKKNKKNHFVSLLLYTYIYTPQYF